MGTWFSVCVTFLIPLEFVVMLGWWFTQAIQSFDPDHWWKPIRVFSVGTCVVQWAVVILVFWLLNRRIADRVLGEDRP